ncbi:MAG: DUF4956 domain-containing protein [Phycisphaerales bacterium]
MTLQTPDWLTESFNTEVEHPLGVLLVRQTLAFALGCVIAYIYWLTHEGLHGDLRTARSRPQPITMMATLVLLTVLIGIIGSVVGNNAARAFALVGALSIVRFRTVVEDTRDTAFVIFAVAIGMAVGAGYLKVPLVGIPFVATAAFLFRPRRQPAVEGEPWTLTVRLGAAFSRGEAVDALLKGQSLKSDLTQVVTVREGAAVDRTYRLRMASDCATNLAEALNSVEGVQQVELKKQD